MIYYMTAGQGYEISSIFIILFAESFEHIADSMDKVSRDTRGVFKNQEIQFNVLFNFKPLFTRLKSYKSVLQYNFSEAQSGKNLCDSKTGSCRMHIARYLNEGNDIVTALDLKKALDSNQGLKGTNVCVISVDNDHEPKINTKIKYISLLNNFEFLHDCIIARKAYQVGIGKTMDIKALRNPDLDQREMTGMEAS